ncbi:MAG: hypothetical protein M9962_06905 [Oligoflexia bacterium]|nr:hypothetical protein [Oligoflexia bacterium]
MNQNDKNIATRPSDDLTIILLRGNGSPKTIRLSVEQIQKAFSTLGIGIIGIVFVLIIAFASFWFEGSSSPNPAIDQNTQTINSSKPIETTESSLEENKEAVTNKPTSGWISSIQSIFSGNSQPTDEELQKEVQGLRTELEEIHNKLEKRQELSTNTNTQESLLLFGNNLAQEINPEIKIENPKSFYNDNNNQLVLDFEIYNTNSQQRQIRGYIVALAKSSKGLFIYPQSAMTPNDNILIRYTKGETFAVSRFRVARATFDLPKNFSDVSLQIFLISTSGKILVNYHYKGEKK